MFIDESRTPLVIDKRLNVLLKSESASTLKFTIKRVSEVRNRAAFSGGAEIDNMRGRESAVTRVTDLWKRSLMNETTMPKVCFVADLHLFARRSNAEAHQDTIINAALNSDLCILGGDIFDFRWSTYLTEDETAHAAVEWLRNFDELTQHCRVHFLLGNHDDHPELLERLPFLEQEMPTFEWSRYYFRLGDTLFLHGDVADRTMTATCLKLQREQFSHGSRTELQHRLYDVAIKAQLHRLAPPAVYPCQRVAKRILAYMTSIGHGQETGVKHVYFGHTHRPMDHYLCEGVHFHNGGAPIGSAPFRILSRTVELRDGETGLDARVRE